MKTKKNKTHEYSMDNEKLQEIISSMEFFLGPWKTTLWRQVIEGLKYHKRKKTFRGFLDAHTHLCRARTYNSDFLPIGVNLSEIADAPLRVKQDFIGDLHNGPAYKKENLSERMEWQINRVIEFGTREMWAVTDTTADIGLQAFEIALELKEKYKGKIILHIGCYPVFGLKNPAEDNDQLDTLEEAAKRANFIVGLPEKDEEDSRVGFKGHVNILLRLGYQHKIPVHMHVDQTNTAHSNDTIKTIECLEGLAPEELNWFTKNDTPRLWLVHMISPTSYESKKFTYLVNKLKKHNIGVIVCPRAALSMRELRSEMTPTHNSVARIIELLSVGINVRLGTDNINDVFVPSGDGLILTEIDLLVDMTRNYIPHIWAKLCIGIPLNNSDRAALKRALYEKRNATENHTRMIRETQRPTKIEFTF